MTEKKENNNQKKSSDTSKDTGYKNRVVEYDASYEDNSNAQE